MKEATRYAAEDADITLRLWLLLKPKLTAEAAVSVYETLERPMVAALATMEERGILIDKQHLAQLSGAVRKTDAARWKKTLSSLVGQSFNIGSPKQLGEILFDKMKLPGGTKTATRPVVNRCRHAGRACRVRP